MTDEFRPIETTTAFKVAENQVSSDLGGEVVILDLEAGEYFGLDGVGARAWELLAEPHSLDELTTAILNEFDVDRDTCERDLREMLATLEGHGVVVRVEDAG